MRARASPSRFVQAKAWRLARTPDKAVADQITAIVSDISGAETLPAAIRSRSPVSAEQINRDQREQEIRNENCGPRILFRHSLTKKQGQNRNRRNERAVKSDRDVVPEDQQDAANCAQSARSGFQDRDSDKQQRHHPGQRTFGKMAPQPIQIALSIKDFVQP
jgi:hypothetical protein